MPALYKSKLIAVGPSCSGKATFFKSSSLNSFFSKDYIVTIGVSIKTAEYVNENNDMVTMSIWDISSSERFRFMYPCFFRGAIGCLLFLDLINDNKMKELNFWVNLIRSLTINIPIFLIGNRTDLIHEELNEFFQNNLIEAYFDNSNQGTDILNRMGRLILENYGSHSKLDFYFRQQNIHYEKFINFFSTCPVCRKKNDRSNLYQLYFSKTPKLENLREKLLDLMEKSEKFTNIYLNQMTASI